MYKNKQMTKKDDLLCIWYLLVVELQGTNQDEERREVPNPFWEKLCRGRLENCRTSSMDTCDLH